MAPIGGERVVANVDGIKGGAEVVPLETAPSGSHPGLGEWSPGAVGGFCGAGFRFAGMEYGA